jgi:hypothetical protein
MSPLPPGRAGTIDVDVELVRVHPGRRQKVSLREAARRAA